MGASSFPGLKFSKPEPRWIRKQAKVTAEAKAQRECYLAVDQRDGSRCRICAKHVGGAGMLSARIHHHLIYRSTRVIHQSWNVVSICPRCDDLIHREGTLRCSGNADARENGRLAGMKVEKLFADVWRVIAWR